VSDFWVSETIALVDTRTEVEGKIIGTVISTPATILDAFKPNEPGTMSDTSQGTSPFTEQLTDISDQGGVFISAITA
jgi:hypothetical protein